MEASILFVAIGTLILLALLSMRYGVDSRDGFVSKERDLAANGIVWGGSLAGRDVQQASAPLIKLNVSGQAQEQPQECIPAPCGA